MMPQKLRTSYPAGEQVALTPIILEFASKYIGMTAPKVFELIHADLLEHMTIKPFEEFNESDLAARLWKLTADELLQLGYFVDTKYCSEMVLLFTAVVNALGYEGMAMKVFAVQEDDKIITHTLAYAKDSSNDTRYILEVGSLDFQCKELRPDKTLTFGEKVGKNWRVWKVARDLWEMGLTDYKQADDIWKEKEIELFLNKTGEGKPSIE
jgi:hypothetical protein